jgi:DNA mismatch repair protein MutS
MAVKESADTIVFLHRLVPGAADRSYGVQVARLAGIPAPVVRRAQQILVELEGGRHLGVKGTPPASASAAAEQLTMFAEAGPLTERLRALDVDGLTPLEALNLLAELKELAG